MADCLKVIVAGEVDAGKSTLIGRFLVEKGAVPRDILEQVASSCRALDRPFEFAYLLDSLEEERRDQLTMDTTQVFCRAGRGHSFVFVDVPGHEALYKNMLSGASYGDTAVVVVDAAKSVEAGTRRHVHILEFLGIDRPVVAVNKMDSVGYSERAFRGLREEIDASFKKAGIRSGDVVPVCAAQGDHLVRRSKRMSWYRGPSLLEALLDSRRNAGRKKPSDLYYPVQDIYEMDQERVLAGMVVSGEVRRGGKVGISSFPGMVRIKAIRALGRSPALARINESVGLVLAGAGNVRRGDVVYGTKAPAVASHIRARLFCVASLKAGDRFTFKCLAREVVATVTSVKRTPGISAPIRGAFFADAAISLEEPVAFKKFSELSSLGRFILKNDEEICAVGLIL